MTFAERIYLGETAEQLQISRAEYEDRNRTLEQFLAVWDRSESFEQAYLTWLQTVPQGRGGTAPPIPILADGKKIDCCSKTKKPTLGTMAASLAAATQAWAKKGFKLVDEEERKKRFAVCTSCEYIYDGGRCSKCGCFMEIKSKLAGMMCPVDKW